MVVLVRIAVADGVLERDGIYQVMQGMFLGGHLLPWCPTLSWGLPESMGQSVTAGLVAPFRGDRILAEEKRCQLDRLYQHICDNLDALLIAVGLKVA